MFVSDKILISIKYTYSPHFVYFSPLPAFPFSEHLLFSLYDIGNYF